jgi:lipoate-protein ligase A
MIDASLYGLPDSSLAYSQKREGFMVWIPETEYIVLGRSNKAEQAVNTDMAKTLKIKIIQRPSGGETVYLSPNTLVISVKLKNEKALKTHDYFKIINAKIIAGLSACGIQNLAERGISDIALGNLKILGSAMHRKPESIFYHGVLNLSESPETFDRLLKHPGREPDYRKGRSHRAFVTSLTGAGYQIDANTVKQALDRELKGLMTE